MPKLIRLLLVLLAISGVYSYRWYNVPYLSISRHAFTKQEMDGFYELENESKIARRNAETVRRLFRSYGCVDQSRGSGDISVYVAQHLQNLSPRLVAAVIITESTCRPEAVSPSGAIGLMQILPTKRYTRKELFQPERNVEIGVNILGHLCGQTGNIRDGLRLYYGVVVGSDEADKYADKILSIARLN